MLWGHLLWCAVLVLWFRDERCTISVYFMLLEWMQNRIRLLLVLI